MSKHKRVSYWSLDSNDALNEYQSNRDGLTSSEALARLKEYGANKVKKQKKTSPLSLFLNQLKNPIILILLAATGISAATGDVIYSLIIVAIILTSLILSFIQEFRAGNALEKLRNMIQIKSTVLRDGKSVDIPSDSIVPGDIVLLSAGSLIPADGLVLESDDFLVNQSIFTGESYPTEKKPEAVAEDTSLAERINCVYMGTSVSSGTSTILIT